MAPVPLLTRNELTSAAASAARVLQQWYQGDSYAASTGLYHWDDPNYSSDAGGAIPAGFVSILGYKDAFQDTSRWWNSANAITALTDYMLLTGDHTYLPAVDFTFNNAPNAYTENTGTVAGYSIAGGVVGFLVGGPVGFVVGLFGGGAVAASGPARIHYTNFLNGYYDDEGWWALAWINAYDLTNDPKYLKMAATIFQDMTLGWDRACRGGLYWAKNHQDSNGNSPYKNAIANELFMAIAAALYLRFAKTGAPPPPAPVSTYLNAALDEWRWFDSSGLINQLDLINDALNTSCRNDGQPVYTYNQGVILRALSDLSEIESDPTYVTRAERIADALIANDVSPDMSGVDRNGVLTEWSDLQPNQSVDHCQFKGIFVRNLAYLFVRRPNARYRAFLLKNANFALASKNSSGQFGHRWDGPLDVADFVRQTAALDLLNASLRVLQHPIVLPFLEPLLLAPRGRIEPLPETLEQDRGRTLDELLLRRDGSVEF